MRDLAGEFLKSVQSEVLKALRGADACPRTLAVMTRPTMPGYNKVPPIFLKAVSWADSCDACATLMLAAIGVGTEAIPVLREPLSCQPCFDDLVAAFKRDRESKDRKVDHPKAIGKIPWCDECVGIVIEHLSKPKEVAHA